jgi:hypothetical protein
LSSFFPRFFGGFAGEPEASGFLPEAPEREIFAPSLKLWKSVLLSCGRRGCDNPATSRKGYGLE